MYQVESKLTERVCKEIGWMYSVQAIETMQRKGTVHVRGTALKLDEARKLESFCGHMGYTYHGPFAR